MLRFDVPRLTLDDNADPIPNGALLGFREVSCSSGDVIRTTTAPNRSLPAVLFQQTNLDLYIITLYQVGAVLFPLGL